MPPPLPLPNAASAKVHPTSIEAAAAAEVDTPQQQQPPQHPDGKTELYVHKEEEKPPAQCSDGASAAPGHARVAGDLEEAIVAAGLSSATYLPAVQSFVAGYNSSPERFELRVDRLISELVAASKDPDLLTPEEQLASAFATHMRSDREAEIAGADEAVLCSLLGEPSGSESTRTFSRSMLHGCGAIARLEREDAISLLLTSDPMQLLTDKESSRRLLAALHIERLVVEGKRFKLVTGIEGAGGGVLKLRRPLVLSAWHAGAISWLSALEARIHEALSDQISVEVDRMSTARDAGEPLRVYPRIMSDKEIISQSLQVAARIHFTEIMEKGDSSEALDWLQRETAALNSAVAEKLSKVARRICVDMMHVVSEYIHVVERDERDGPGPWMRVHFNPSSESPRRPMVSMGIESTQVPHGLEIANISMLVKTVETETIREGLITELSPTRPGVVCVFGPAGTGKTETYKDVACELGRRAFVLKLTSLDDASAFYTRLEQIFASSGTMVMIDLDPCHKDPGLDQAHRNSRHASEDPDKDKAIQAAITRLVALQANARSAAKQAAETGSPPLLGSLAFAFDPKRCPNMLSWFFQELGSPENPQMGSLSSMEWSQSNGGTFIQCIEPDFKDIVNSIQDAEGLKEFSNFPSSFAAFLSVQQMHPGVDPRTSKEDGNSDTANKRVMDDRFVLLKERDTPGTRAGIQDIRLASSKIASGLMGSAAGENRCTYDSKVAFGHVIAACPQLFVNRLLPERGRRADEATILTRALDSQLSPQIIQDVINAEIQACRHHDYGPVKPETPPCSTLTAMDIAMLSSYSPDVAVMILKETKLKAGSAKVYEGSRVDIEEFACLDCLLPAVLKSECVDQLLALPAFQSLLDTKMAVLWPIWYLESAMLLALWSFYFVWHRGEAWSAWPAGSLACLLGVLEGFQLWSNRSPLFGDPSLGRLMNFVTDPYNVVDAMAVTMVLVTLLAESDNRLVAITLLLLLLKIIGTFRSLEAFGFLVSMLLDTVAEIRTFAFLLALMLAGFSFIFEAFIEDMSLSEWLWAMYRLGILGDFDDSIFWDDDGGLAVPLFLFLTVATTVIMLNVLITIVGEAYGKAQSHRDELGWQTRADTIIELESKYLWPWAVQATRRGKPCKLVQYPRCLVHHAGFRLRDPTQLDPWHHRDSTLSTHCGRYPGSEIPELELQAKFPDEGEGMDTDQLSQMLTQREVLRFLTENVAALQRSLDPDEVASTAVPTREGQ